MDPLAERGPLAFGQMERAVPGSHERTGFWGEPRSARKSQTDVGGLPGSADIGDECELSKYIATQKAHVACGGQVAVERVIVHKW